MNCPSCGAPMRPAAGNGSLRCDYCNAVVVIKPDDTGVKFLDVAAELQCPICAVALWDGVLADVKVRACKRCHGLLVAMGALEELIDQMRAENPDSAIAAAADDADLKRVVSCPKCHQHMDTHFYYGGGHAVVSGCERCELIWLDGGVLMRIVRAPHRTSSY